MLSNLLTEVPDEGYSRLSNLLTKVPDEGYSRLSNLLTMRYLMKVILGFPIKRLESLE
jgi:hypothetical protein